MLASVCDSRSAPAAASLAMGNYNVQDLTDLLLNLTALLRDMQQSTDIPCLSPTALPKEGYTTRLPTGCVSKTGCDAVRSEADDEQLLIIPTIDKT